MRLKFVENPRIRGLLSSQQNSSLIMFSNQCDTGTLAERKPRVKERFRVSFNKMLHKIATHKKIADYLAPYRNSERLRPSQETKKRISLRIKSNHILKPQN